MMQHLVRWKDPWWSPYGGPQGRAREAAELRWVFKNEPAHAWIVKPKWPLAAERHTIHYAGGKFTIRCAAFATVS